MGLLDLPSEILQDIHLLALNPLFPQTHPVVYQSCHQASSHFVASYLLSLYSHFGKDILPRALRHPICTLEVVRSIKTLCKLQLTCMELPRRMFRGITRSSPIPPLLVYLLDTYASSVNSHNGYALCRAVMAENTGLIEYLLDHGASLKNTLAVEIAVSRNQLHLVKLLVESTTRSPKRRKMEDRMTITPRLLDIAMKKHANEIVNYFVREKGVMPPLRTIMKMA